MPMNISLYRTIWRWHFYAGLIILPVLAWMAVTGALYLYKPEIERALHHEWIDLGQHVRPMPLAPMIRVVEEQAKGLVTQVTRPGAPDESWRMAVQTDEGERFAFIDPATGRLLGTTRAGGSMDMVKDLHSLTVAGPVGNVLVEIVAGWAILLVLTGFYLWWPRAGNKALSLAGRVGERRFWRNLHASTGVLAGLVILFLAITGMPWSTFWGGRFHAFVAQQGIGRPQAPQDASGGDHDAHLPWSMQGMAQPDGTGSGIDADAAVAAAEERGLRAPWVLNLPAAAGKPYRLAPVITRAQDARIVYVDAGTGKVVQDVRHADFGVGARAFDWGIYTHMGQQYGEANRLVMLAGCIGVLLLAASAPILWWKRRQGGKLSQPPAASDRGKARGVAAIMLVIGALFPLTGLTMIIALAGEWAMGMKGSRFKPAAT
jgi:uncharacterized iron-regulated membrane protein